MSNWADLPKELLILILSNIFAKDRQTCRLVCKSWNEAVLVSPYHSFPCLTFYQKSTLWKFFQYNRFFSMQISEIHNAEILCSKYGWLLMSRHKFDLILFHPFSGEIIEIPTPVECYEVLCFFNPPTSLDCIIVGIGDLNSSVGIGMLELGDYECYHYDDYEWNHYEYNCKKPFLLASCTPILHGGSLYFLDVKGNVGKFNIEKSSFEIHANCILPACLRGKLKQHFLIELHGEGEEDAIIFAVFVLYDRKKLNVYRLLEPDMKWELVKDLGNKMLFLSGVGSFAKIAPTDSMRNNIYLTKFFGDSGIFYSLETKKYHSIDGVYNSRTCYGLAESFAAWIVPT